MSHPDRDCDGCGVHHMPWSVHQRDAEVLANAIGDDILLESTLREVLGGWANVDALAVSAVLRSLADEYEDVHGMCTGAAPDG